VTVGWTFDQINAAPFPEVLNQLDYWAQYPPAHLLLRGFVGYKPPRSKTEPTEIERRLTEQTPIPYSEIPACVLDAMKQEAASG
jgi:hypothetical protein